MTVSLANHYRPHKASEILGHPRHRRIIQTMVETGEFPGSILLSGPPGTGKTTTARVIAKIAVCRNRQPNGDPCNECEGCRSVDNLGGANLYYLDGGAKDMTDLVRDELIPFFQSRPLGGVKHKVLILDEFQRVSGSAKSVLLAPLEELPTQYPWVIALFTTTDPEQIHDALVSRCMPMIFRPLKADEMVRGVLQSGEIEPTPEAIQGLTLLAEASQGCMRKLWNSVQQLRYLQEPMTPELASWMTGGVPPETRREFWAAVEHGKIDRALHLWDRWVADGANPALLGESLTDDMVEQAALKPDSKPWIENLAWFSKIAMANRPNYWRRAIASLQPAPYRQPDPVEVSEWQPTSTAVPEPQQAAGTWVQTNDGPKLMEASLVAPEPEPVQETEPAVEPTEPVDAKQVVLGAFRDRVLPIPDPAIELLPDLEDTEWVFQVIFKGAA